MKLVKGKPPLKFKTKPYDHQALLLKKSYDEPFFAFFMEQGTGKTKPILDHSANLYLQGTIDSLVVIASPTGAVSEWEVDHIPDHLPLKPSQYLLEVWSPSTTKKNLKRLKDFADDESGKFKIFLANVEAFASNKANDYLKYFMMGGERCYLTLDESTSIKTPTARRTKALLKISEHEAAVFKRIMTGTPSTQGLLDLFTQCKFLSPDILKQKSYYTYRARYCFLRDIKLPTGVSFKKVMGYQPWAMDEIKDLMAPYSFRVLKDDCLDLPKKIYSTKRVQLEPEQKRLYNTLKDELVVEFAGKTLSVDMALKKMLRLQQIVGGFFPSETIVENEETEEANIIKELTPIFDKPEKNPKLATTLSILESMEGKALIFCRFTAEVEMITKAIHNHFRGKGERHNEVRGEYTIASPYYGGVKKADRKPITVAFQKKPFPRFLVLQLKSASKSLTLHAAEAVIYFSNSFSLEDRLQSEDRAHRAGLKHKVVYYDLVAENTLDVKIIKALRDKKEIADAITGDNVKEWI